MLKRMILAGLLAATAAPVLASDASFDKAQTQTTTTASTAKSDSTPKVACDCSHKHAA